MVIKKKKPYSECEINRNEYYDSDFVQQHFSKDMIYKKVNCQLNCFLRIIPSICNCTMATFPIPKVKFCETKEENACQIKAYYNARLTNPHACNHECPLECERFYYSYGISSQRFPKTSYAEYLRNSTEMFAAATIDEIKESTFRLIIYLESIGYNEMKEIAMFSILNLFSNIGGIFGLCLGMSILSFIEILELVWGIIILCFEK